MRGHLHAAAVLQGAFPQLKSAMNMWIVRMEVMRQPGCVVCTLTFMKHLSIGNRENNICTNEFFVNAVVVL